MCEPTTWAMVGMAALAAGSTYMQVDAQNKQTDYQNANATTEQQNAVNAAKIDYSASEQQQQQLAQQAADQKFTQRREAAKERAMLRLNSQENGLNGSVVTSQFQALEVSNAMANNVTDNNQVNQNQQNNFDMLKIGTNAQSRINQAQSNKRYGISGINSGLQIATSGASGAFTGATTAKTMGW